MFKIGWEFKTIKDKIKLSTKRKKNIQGDRLVILLIMLKFQIFRVKIHSN